MNPLAIILASLGSGVDKFANYFEKMTMAKQLAQMEDEILRARQAEAGQRGLEEYKQKLLMQVGEGMPEKYISAVRSLYEARRRPRAASSGTPALDEEDWKKMGL